jgi:hypothetical protein
LLAKAGAGIRFNEDMEGDGETVFRDEWNSALKVSCRSARILATAMAARATGSSAHCRLHEPYRPPTRSHHNQVSTRSPYGWRRVDAAGIAGSLRAFEKHRQYIAPLKTAPVAAPTANKTVLVVAIVTAANHGLDLLSVCCSLGLLGFRSLSGPLSSNVAHQSQFPSQFSP